MTEARPVRRSSKSEGGSAKEVDRSGSALGGDLFRIKRNLPQVELPQV